jgi:hypothetical protein
MAVAHATLRHPDIRKNDGFGTIPCPTGGKGVFGERTIVRAEVPVKPSRFRDAKVVADSSREKLVDLTMPWHC